MDEDFGDDAAYTAAFDTAQSSITPKAVPVTAQSPTTNTSTSNTSKGTPSKVQQPTPQPLPSRQAPSTILVSHRQRGNPILSNIKQVPWEWSDIPADFVLGQTTCALFLQLKYHRLHPEYIYQRIRSLGHKYNLRVLLAMVDIENHEEALKELSKTSLINNLTLILCWSAKEAGHYLELFKSFEGASSNSIRAPQARGYSEKLTEFVTAPRSINKTDALSLVANFGSLRDAINARPEEISLVGGWGEKKVQRWYGAVNEPFRTRKAAKRGAGTGTTRESSRVELGRDVTHGGPARDDITAADDEIMTAEDRGSAARRTKDDVRGWESGEEGDEEMLIAAAEDHAREQQATGGQPGSVERDGTSKRTDKGIPSGGDEHAEVNKDGEGLSGDIVAALARLREHG
ncbi:MAG: ssDNA endonuclease and repair protein rad10 [Sclerophora amabilis]|nr:MAG: ssDNA endonuclease and repair protein rad10 [Sclerophora amabilis]